LHNRCLIFRKYVALPLTILGVVILWARYFPNRYICIFKNIFDIPCPGCGMTRAFYEIISGDFSKAFYYNSLSIPLFIFIIMSTIWILSNLISGNDSYERFMTGKISNKTIIALVLLVIANWVWNIIKGI